MTDRDLGAWALGLLSLRAIKWKRADRWTLERTTYPGYGTIARSNVPTAALVRLCLAGARRRVRGAKARLADAEAGRFRGRYRGVPLSPVLTRILVDGLREEVAREEMRLAVFLDDAGLRQKARGNAREGAEKAGKRALEVRGHALKNGRPTGSLRARPGVWRSVAWRAPARHHCRLPVREPTRHPRGGCDQASTLARDVRVSRRARGGEWGGAGRPFGSPPRSRP